MDEKSFLTANTYSSGSVLKIHDLFWYPTVKLPRKVPRKSKYNTLRVALCSRNFKNVKLRIDFVEIWSCYHHSDFTWNPNLANSNVPKMLFLAISEVLNFDFCKFEQLSSPKFNKIQISESLKLPKMTFLDHLNSPKFDSK